VFNLSTLMVVVKKLMAKSLFLFSLTQGDFFQKKKKTKKVFNFKVLTREIIIHFSLF
jgi:hypothetical protein